MMINDPEAAAGVGITLAALASDPQVSDLVVFIDQA
jgi:hypothetical protein